MIWNHKQDCACRACNQAGMKWSHAASCECRVCRPLPLADRFWQKVEKAGESECWEWVGTIDRGGYGRIQVEDRLESAHRVSWMLARGAIPHGLWVLHQCDNRKCVNVAHLFLGTRTDNVRDMYAKGRGVSAHARKTHCPQGHPYDAENTRICGRARRCKECDRACHRSPRYAAKRRARRLATYEPRA